MPDTNELKTLQERILAGDVAAVPAFRKKLRADPAALENWRVSRWPCCWQRSPA